MRPDQLLGLLLGPAQLLALGPAQLVGGQPPPAGGVAVPRRQQRRERNPAALGDDDQFVQAVQHVDQADELVALDPPPLVAVLVADEQHRGGPGQVHEDLG